MKFHLMTTHQYGKDNPDELARLIRSVEQQTLNPGDEIALWCLIQGATEHEADPAIRQATKRVRFLWTSDLMALSRARNKLIANIPPRPDLFVLFPDDDCWYQDGFFSWLSQQISNSGSDLLFVGHCDPPAAIIESRIEFKRPSDIDVMRGVNSISMVISATLAASVGAFDERLGLGTAFGGGEDSDYAFRAFEISHRPLITSAELVGHRKLARDFRSRVAEMSRYWPGVMLQTLLHLKPSLFKLALYRSAVGIYLLMARRLSLSRFLLPFSEWLRPSA
jgi:hypothetical protein